MTMILSDIASRLASGSLSARDHVESCLAAIEGEDGARAVHAALTSMYASSVDARSSCDAPADTARSAERRAEKSSREAA